MKVLKIFIGSILTANFLVFWGAPIALQGIIWKEALSKYLLFLFDLIDQNTFLRKIAVNYVYTNPRHSDFFATSLILLIYTSLCLGYVFYYQLTRNTLPWWLIIAYYFAWVGVGGRIMGAAYALAHKEGHNRSLYKKLIRETVGNIFENVLGVFYGNVPWNFTTSHVFIHHRLDGGVGDTFYEWDIDRTSLSDFMLYVYRILLHMVGYSSLKFFTAHGYKAKADLLRKGVVTYIFVAVALLLVTRSLSFVFWIYIQPLLCMSYFLALLNIGFHGFIEFDENGQSIACVNATTIIDGSDDTFGEDDHMAHHYNSNVYYRDLKPLQASKVEEFRKYKASVFQKLSIVELSIFIIFNLWEKLADHYVDYTGQMSRVEIIEMLKRRAKTKETSYEQYEKYLANPTLNARKAMVSTQEEKSEKELDLQADILAGK